MIKPTVGRIVWYRHHAPETPEEQPVAAIVTKVNSDDTVNLTIFPAVTLPHPHMNVKLRQEDDPIPVGEYCEWMPYQIGQAKAAVTTSSADTPMATKKSNNKKH